MIPRKTVDVFKWDDIQEAISKEIGIDVDRWHNLNGWSPATPDGKEYQNLWHEFLEHVIPERMRNDSYVNMGRIDEDYFPTIKQWVVPALQAYNKLLDETDPDENGVVVWFSW